MEVDTDRLDRIKQADKWIKEGEKCKKKRLIINKVLIIRKKGKCSLAGSS